VGKIINKRAEAIVLQEIARQENIIKWYKEVNRHMADHAETKIKELQIELEQIRNDYLN
jgi:hypothetical protein